MANIIKIELCDDAGNDGASLKQLAYIESLCASNDCTDRFLALRLAIGSGSEARKHITVQMASLWIKCLRNHLKWKFEHVSNNIKS